MKYNFQNENYTKSEMLFINKISIFTSGIILELIN